MEGLLFILFIAAIAALPWAATSPRAPKRVRRLFRSRGTSLVRSFSEAADRLGGRWAWDDRAARKTIAVEALIELVAVRAAAQKNGTVFTAEGVPPSLELHIRERRLPADVVPTGDAAFDRRFAAHGGPAHVLACLPEEVRDWMITASGVGTVEVSGGRLTLEIPEPKPSADLLVDWLRFTALLARRMQEHGRDPRGSLERTARSDACRPVRREAFRQLAAAFSTRADALAPELLAHDDPAVAALAARHLGAAGLPTLRTIARTSSDDDAIALAAEGLAALGDTESAPALVRLLESRAHPVRLAALRALGEIGGRDAVEHLLAFGRSLLLDDALKLAARRAIADIQARLGPAGAGRLSLAPSDTGGALTIARTGAISLNADEPMDPPPPEQAP